MAELRATDIIDKLRKINKRVDEIESQGISIESLKESGAVLAVKVNGESHTTNKDGIVDLGNLSSGGISEIPVAGEDKLGGIKLWSGQSIQGQYYLALDENDRAYIYIPNASSTQDGIMLYTDKLKLNTIEEGAQKNPGLVTANNHGLMSIEDKSKLDHIENNANKYTVSIIDLRNGD